MNQNQKDQLARALGIDPETQATLDTGSGHPYHCRCETCRQWWKAMGPDPDTGRHGPFTAEEIAKP